MFDKLLSFLENAKHGASGAAIGAGFVVFTATLAVLQAFGVGGSPLVLLSLAVPALVVAFLVYAILLHLRLRRLEKQKTISPVPELRARVDDVISELGDRSTAAMAVRGIIDDYEEKIRHLQKQLQGPDLPGEPVVVDGGPLTIVEDSKSGAIFLDTFYIDPYPVTNLQFAEFVKEESEWRAESIYDRYGIPYYLCEFRGIEMPEDKWDHPVVWINWYAAAAFCNWRSRKEGRQEVYRFRGTTTVEADLSKDGWRLPTEAEWERAARGADSAEHPWPDGVTPSKANYGNHYRGTTAVGRFGSNSLGVFDMLGNIKEWCHDWWSDSFPPDDDTSNPTGPSTGRFKAFRGASWMEGPQLLAYRRRGKLPRQNTNPDFGFRCVRRPLTFASKMAE